MTQYARLYGGSLYDLAAEENLTDAIGEQMKAVSYTHLDVYKRQRIMRRILGKW